MKVVVVAAAAAAIVVAAVILVGVLVGISNYSCKNIYFLSGYFWISPSFGCCSLRHSCHLTPGNCSEIRTEQEYINIKRNFNNSSYPESVTSASVGGKTRATVKDQKIATACVPNDKGLSKNIKICRPHDARSVDTWIWSHSKYEFNPSDGQYVLNGNGAFNRWALLK